MFEEDADWQNPVMNFVGEYQSGRAHALVECLGSDEAWITIEWGGSAWQLARWDIIGRLDTETLTVAYSNVTKSILTYDDGGELVTQEPEYEDGSGTITFHDDGTFTWHEDQSESGEDMLFEWVPVNMSGDETVRQDGERFETDIMIEGREETVQYAHFVNYTLGFEMDYDYERFTRIIEADREFFVSVWDDDQNPENYLEITHSSESAEAVAASVKEALSLTYDPYEEARELDRAGSCTYIEASVLKGTNTMGEQLELVYIIPADDGCFVATEHLVVEAAEGFGRRFACMLNTLAPLMETAQER